MAGEPAQQGLGLLGRNRQVPGSRHDRGRRLRHGVRPLEFAGLPHGVGQVDVHGQQQVAHRGRLFEQHGRLHQRVSTRAGASTRHGRLVRRRVAPRSRSDLHHKRAVDCQRQHPEPAAIQRSGVGFVRDRLAQHEGRSPADVGAFRSHQGRQCRPRAAVSEWQHRHSLHRAQLSPGL